MSHRLAGLGALTLAVACSSGPTGSSVARVVITGDDATLVIADTKQYSARAEDAAGATVSGAPIVWQSTAPAVASVSTAGLVTAATPGVARIIASSGTRADTVTVTVGSSTVANVIVTVNRALLKVSDTVRAEVRAVNEQGQTVTGREAIWSTSNPSAALVTPFGLVLGLAPANPVTVSATIDGKTGSTTIAIIPADIAEVIVSPDSALMRPGGTAQLQVQVFDEFGFEVVDPEVTWSSFVDQVASIDQHGRVTALTIGESTISATIRGRTGTALVRVLDVNTEKFYIDVTNYLQFPIEILENGNSVGSLGAHSSGTFERPLRQTFQFGWALIRPQGRGEEMFEVGPIIQGPVGTYHYEVDNVLADGRVFFTPFIRNLSPTKVIIDPLPKVEAGTCICPVSPEIEEVRNLGYWLFNPASVLRFFLSTDIGLTDLRLTVPVSAIEDRSGIFRYQLLAVP